MLWCSLLATNILGNYKLRNFTKSTIVVQVLRIQQNTLCAQNVMRSKTGSAYQSVIKCPYVYKRSAAICMASTTDQKIALQIKNNFMQPKSTNI